LDLVFGEGLPGPVGPRRAKASLDRAAHDRAAAHRQGIIMRYDGHVALRYAVDGLAEAAITIESQPIKAFNQALGSAHAARCLKCRTAASGQLGLPLNAPMSHLETLRLALGLSSGTQHRR
jgi:hypothetical protein